MIKGIGCDIVEMERVVKLTANAGVMARVFSKDELAEVLCVRVCERAAASFAAKEALSKALGCGLKGLRLNEISLLRRESGEPYFEFSGAMSDLLPCYGVTHAHVSVSHDQTQAMAFVVLE